MTYKPATMLIYHAVVLLLLVSLHGENSAESSSCSVVKEQNIIVNIKESRANSTTTKAIQGLLLADELSCRERCCSNDECTVYVFYNSPGRQFNCFLIRCLPTSSCIRSRLNGSVVGVIKRNSLNPVVRGQPHTVTSIKSNQGVTLETSITQTPIDITPSAMEQRALKTSNGSKVSPTSTTSTSSHVSTSSIPVTPHTPTSHTTTHPTTTKTHNKTSTTLSTEHNHTNKTSLVIALFFGILFLLAVMLIVGRPWWEFIQRPRYSKVDYLMNGL